LTFWGVLQSNTFTYLLFIFAVLVAWWYLRQKPVGGVRQVVPTLPFPLSLPSPFPFHLSFQTNQWEGRSDPVRGKFPASPYKYHPGEW